MKKRATGSAAKIPQSARRPLLLRYDINVSDRLITYNS